MKRLADFISIGAIFGFIFGIYSSLEQIISNRFIQHGMIRSTLSAFRYDFNRSILFFFLALLLLYGMALFSKGKIKHTRKGVALFILTISVLFLIAKALKIYSGYTLPMALRLSCEEIYHLIIGKSSLDVVVKLAQKYFFSFSIPIGFTFSAGL